MVSPPKIIRHLLLTITAGLLAMPVVGLSNAPANADPYFSPKPDRGKHSYCYWSKSPPSRSVREQIYNSTNNLRFTTDVDAAYKSKCDTSGKGQTDVLWRKNNGLGENTYGRAACKVKWSSNKCDRFTGHINQKEIEEDADHYANQFRKTSCHELGHTVGVRHYRNDSPDGNSHSCMRSGIRDSGGSYFKYGKHHRTKHINKLF